MASASITFIIGLIIGIMGIATKRIVYLINVLLCAFTSTLFLRIKFGVIHLWSISEYTDENYNRFIPSSLAIYGVLFTILSMFIFRFLFRVLFSRLILSRLKSWIYPKINALSKQKKEHDFNIMVKGLVFIMTKLFELNIISAKKRLEKEEVSRVEIEMQIVSMVSYSIQLLLIVCFVFHTSIGATIISSLFVVLFSAILIFYLPVMSYFSNEIDNVIIEMHNKFYEIGKSKENSIPYRIPNNL